jgi:hypothetical protein
MARRIARSLALSLSLAAVVFAGSACRKPKETASGPTRPVAAVWADVLAQRDAIHGIMVKELEAVTHQDCADLGADARKLDGLVTELTAAVSADKTQTEGHLRAVGDVLNRVSASVQKIRESALAEAPGMWVKLRFPFDQALRDVETYFSPEQLGGESVVRRPGFEVTPPPAGLSPV